MGVDGSPRDRLGLRAQEPVARGAVDSLCDPGDRLLEAFARNDLRDEAQREGLLRIELASREAEIAGDGAAHEIVERRVDHVAERELGVSEASRSGGDAHVAAHGEIEASRQRRTPQVRRAVAGGILHGS